MSELILTVKNFCTCQVCILVRNLFKGFLCSFLPSEFIERYRVSGIDINVIVKMPLIHVSCNDKLMTATCQLKSCLPSYLMYLLRCQIVFRGKGLNDMVCQNIIFYQLFIIDWSSFFQICKLLQHHKF